jgi:hypothetical protein
LTEGLGVSVAVLTDCLLDGLTRKGLTNMNSSFGCPSAEPELKEHTKLDLSHSALDLLHGMNKDPRGHKATAE